MGQINATEKDVSMHFRKRFTTVLAICAFAGVGLIAAPSAANLERYVTTPESAFEWRVKDKIDREPSGNRIYDLQIVAGEEMAAPAADLPACGGRA